MSSDTLLFELTDHVAIITLNRPDVRNAMNRELRGNLLEALQRVCEDSDIRVAVITGAGRTFSAGADLKELGSLIYATKEQIAQGLTAGHQIFGAVGNLPYPTVALIDGQCMGGGTELALAMDYRLVADSPKTSIGLPEVKVGIIPGWGGTQRLPRLVGVNSSIEMICSGEPIDAFRNMIISAENISVNMPKISPFGMSFFGSTDSSAASGSSSIARNSHTANGSAASTPVHPNGRNAPLPFGSSTAVPSGPAAMFSAQREKSANGIALIQNTTSTASASTVTVTEILNDTSTPQ